MATVQSQQDKLLAQNALAKRKAGKSLTVAEKTALQRVQNATLLDMLRAMQPKAFNDLFGIQAVQRNQWEETLDIPCGRGRETIDMFKVASRIKDIFSKRKEIARIFDKSGAADPESEEKIKKLQLQNEKLQIELDELKCQLKPIEDVDLMFRAYVGLFAEANKTLRKTFPEAYEIVEDTINRALELHRSNMWESDA